MAECPFPPLPAVWSSPADFAVYKPYRLHRAVTASWICHYELSTLQRG